MKKVILSLFIAVGFIFNTAIFAANGENNEVTKSECNGYYTVEISLVWWDNGEPISGESVRGPMSAYNVNTGEYFWSEDYFNIQIFEDLPEGTYRFDGYDGYFCGYSSVVKTITSDESFKVKIWCE